MTDPIRFGDIQNGFYWGMQASGPQGYLNQYEKMADEEFDWGRWLDYAPLRLLVMDQWGKWVRANYPLYASGDSTRWDRSYNFNRPVLYFNTLMDLVGATCAFFLTRLWIIRVREREKSLAKPSPFIGVVPGLVAALTLWLNPAMLLSTFGWPTWDAWIVPMYLLAALLACLDWWFCAGLVIAAGAMFKGQQLTVAPIFVLWPLVMGRLGSASRWVAGLAAGMATIASPWLFSYLPPEALKLVRFTHTYNYDPLTSPEVLAVHRIIEYPAIFWVIGVIAAAVYAPLLVDRLSALFPPEFRGRRLRPRMLGLSLALATIFLITLWPWFLHRNHPEILLGIALSAAFASAAIELPHRARPFIAPLAGGAAALLCIFVFHGSHAWWDCGFHYGTIHWDWMIMGHTDNLPGILEVRYKWPESALATATTVAPLPGYWPLFTHLNIWPAVPLVLTSKMLFDAIYTVLLLISGVGLGLHARRRDPRFLPALITPWVLFFTFPVQIHERYLLFAAGAAAICIGQSLGTYLLGLVLSFITLMMTLHVMLISAADIDGFGANLNFLFPWIFSTHSGKTILRYLDGSWPDAGWAVLVCAGVFMYLSLTPTKRHG